MVPDVSLSTYWLQRKEDCSSDEEESEIRGTIDGLDARFYGSWPELRQ